MHPQDAFSDAPCDVLTPLLVGMLDERACRALHIDLVNWAFCQFQTLIHMARVRLSLSCSLGMASMLPCGILARRIVRGGIVGRNAFRESYAMAIPRRFVRRIRLVAPCLPDDALGRPSSCVEDVSGRARLDSLVVRSSLRRSFNRMSRYCRGVASPPQGTLGPRCRRDRGGIGRRRSFGVFRRRVCG